ncbi:unnamed protein product [Sphagnum balticum]
MEKLKIINRSGAEIRLTKLVVDAQIGETITIPPDHEHNYACDSKLIDNVIRLDLPHQHPSNQPCIHLDGNFIDANKIAYVRMGDGDRWFVDPVHRATKLVRKHVYNSTISPIALAEFVLEQAGETKRVPDSDPAVWTAWWEITVPSRQKYLLIVDPVAALKAHRRYFVQGRGGPPLFGSPDEVMSRQQNNNVNGDICDIVMTQCNEYVEVKEHPRGMLELTSSSKPPYLV